MLNYQEICVKVCDAARKAGAFIAEERKIFSFSRVEFKGAHDLVSYVDKGAEEIVVAELRKIIPLAGFITEEGTAKYNNEEYKWVIDPLDGTTNFVHGLAPYCVSIALMKDDEIVVGVVYEVTHEELFYAWKGSEAYLNGNIIRVSDVDNLNNALIAVGFSHNILPHIERELKRLEYYQRNTDGIRRIGSATADLVYVACGRIDAFEQIKLSAWDVAAGALIAERAGAVVTDFSRGNNYVFGGEIVAATPKIYEAFLKTAQR